tara:strand:+ start:5138 stop:5890 length:753 start_codon:yes stop_codon:yes gene_type:complete
MDLFFLLCFFAGVLSFLSPCVLPIVPSYLCYLTGVSLRDISDNQSDYDLRRKIIIRSICFVFGFSFIFISMGASVTILRPVINFSFEIFGVLVNLQKFAGLVIIILGLNFFGLLKFDILSRTFTINSHFQSNSNIISFVMGSLFAFGWTPCIGPVLATVLTIAAAEETVIRGVILLTFYSAGLGVPFILSSFAIDKVLYFIKKIGRNIKYIEYMMGAILIFTGVSFILGWIEDGAFFLLENFGFLSNFGI